MNQNSTQVGISLLNSPLTSSTFSRQNALSPKQPIFISNQPIIPQHSFTPSKENFKSLNPQIQPSLSYQPQNYVQQTNNINAPFQSKYSSMIPITSVNTISTIQLKTYPQEREYPSVIYSNINSINNASQLIGVQSPSKQMQAININLSQNKVSTQLSDSFIAAPVSPQDISRQPSPNQSSIKFETTPVCHQQINFKNVTDAEQQDKEKVLELVEIQRKKLEDNLTSILLSAKKGMENNEKELKNLRIIIDEQHRKIQMKLESDIERRGRVEGEWIEIIQKAAQESQKMKDSLKELEIQMESRIEDTIRREVAKTLKGKIKGLVERQWEDSESKAYDEVENLKKQIELMEEKNNQGYLEAGEYLKEAKEAIEKAFFSGQNYIKENLEAFGQNLKLKINSEDIKSVFRQMNEGFYNDIDKQLLQLKQKMQESDGNSNNSSNIQSKLNSSLNQLEEGIKIMEQNQQKTEQLLQSIYSSVEAAQQSQNKVLHLEQIVLKISEDTTELATRRKIGFLMETLSRLQENFVSLKRKYEDEKVLRINGNSQQNQHFNPSLSQSANLNNTSINSSLVNSSMNAITISSFNSQLIQLQNVNKQLSDSVKSKEGIIFDQQQEIFSLEKKLQAQQQRQQNLMQEIKGIKQEVKSRQVDQEQDSIMLSSIVEQSQALTDSMDSQLNSARKNISLFRFDQLADYKEDEEEDDNDSDSFEHQFYQQQLINSNLVDTNSFLKKPQSSDQILPNSLNEDLFFYPNSQHQQQEQQGSTQHSSNFSTRKIKSSYSSTSSAKNSKALIIPRQSFRNKKQSASATDKQLSNQENKQYQTLSQNQSQSSSSTPKQIEKNDSTPNINEIQKQEPLEHLELLSHLIKRRLLYNNTLAENKQSSLKCTLTNDLRLKDQYGKYIYDKNGQAMQFSSSQLKYLIEDAKIIEL